MIHKVVIVLHMPTSALPVNVEDIIVQNSFNCTCLWQAYDIWQAKRGKCVIFNMETVGGFPPRHGTRTDGALLFELFSQLHFDVEHLMDYTEQVVCAQCLL